VEAKKVRYWSKMNAKDRIRKLTLICDRLTQELFHSTISRESLATHKMEIRSEDGKGNDDSQGGASDFYV
jgi:hypothetical protein